MKTKPKILFLKDLRSAPTNGAEINTYRLMKRLNDDGFDATIRVFDPLEDMDAFLYYLHSNQIQVIDHSSTHLNYSLFDINIHIDRRINFDRDNYAQTTDIKAHIIAELKILKPDIIFCILSDFIIVEAVLESKIPLVAFLTDNEFPRPETLDQHPHGTKIRTLIQNIPHFTAPSVFLQNSFQEIWGKSSMLLYGLMPKEDYIIEKGHNRKLYGMVNTAPHKGFALFALLAAAFPHESFSTLLSAPANERQKQALCLLKEKTANITFEGPYLDARDFFKKLKVLLVPSIWEEAFGRVVVEAGLNGIPVLGSNRGGIPEALNGGGIILDPPILDPNGLMLAKEMVTKNRTWFETIQKLSDADYYEKECHKMREASFQMLEKIEKSYENFVNLFL